MTMLLGSLARLVADRVEQRHDELHTEHAGLQEKHRKVSHFALHSSVVLSDNGRHKLARVLTQPVKGNDYWSTDEQTI